MYTYSTPVAGVSAEDPRVRQAVEEAESKVRSASLDITTEMYMKALRNGIQDAERKRRDADPNGQLL